MTGVTHFCGHILIALVVLVLCTLIVQAIFRCVQEKRIHTLFAEKSFAVDLLETDKKVDVMDICAKQGVESRSGMTILVAQDSDRDGLYIVDAMHRVIFFTCIQEDHNYLVKMGKHCGSTWTYHGKTSAPQNRATFQVQKNDAIMLLQEPLTEATVYIQDPSVRRIQLQCSDMDVLITIVCPTATKDNKLEVFFVLQQQTVWIERNISQLALVGNLVQKS